MPPRAFSDFFSLLLRFSLIIDNRGELIFDFLHATFHDMPFDYASCRHYFAAAAFAPLIYAMISPRHYFSRRGCRSDDERAVSFVLVRALPDALTLCC